MFSTLLLLTEGMFLSTFAALLWLALFVFAAGGVARLRPGMLLSQLRPMLPLMAMMILLNASLTPGRVCLRPFGDGWGLTEEGVRQGLFFSFRLIALVLVGVLLTLTTSPLDLADGMERLLRPWKRFGVPAHELAMTLTIALRFVPTLADEADRLRQAQRARGADFDGGPLSRARGLMSLLAPLFLSAFRRADRLAVAMEARCYREEGRSHFARMAFGRKDALAAIPVLLVAAGMWCWK